MRVQVGLILVSVCSCRAWGPFGKGSDPAESPSPALTASDDPFLDSSLPHSTYVSPPVPLAVQDPEGTTLPVPTAASPPGAVSQLTHMNYGIWEKVLPGLLRPAPLANTPYDGLEYRKGPIRFRPALFRYDAVVLLLGLFYIYAVYSGKRKNRDLAQRWLLSVFDLLESQFARIEPLKAEGSADYHVWASGRRNIRSGARIHISLKPRGDVLFKAYELIRSIVEPTWTDTAVDRIEIDMPIESGADYIVSVAEKAALQRLRRNWNLATFAPVNESSLLPQAYCVMSETNSLQDALLRDKDLAIPAMLSSHGGRLPVLEQLTISDIGTEQPSEETLMSNMPLPKDRKVTLSFKLQPKTDSEELLIMALNLVDLLAKGRPTLPDGAGAKVAKRRSDIVNGLRKPLLEEQREERERKAAEAKRQMDRDRQGRMTPAQVLAEEQKAKRKMQRKQQSKLVRRA